MLYRNHNLASRLWSLFCTLRLAWGSPLFINTTTQGMSTMKHNKAPIDPKDPVDSPAFMFKLVGSMGLILLGGLFAGLTLALMGSDDMQLRVLATSSADPKERKHAASVLRLLKRGRHWVLVIVNESLPIFLDDVLGGNGFRAVIISTIGIVIFGEVIPQSVCVRYGLAIGGYCAPFVLVIMYLLAPIAWPIAKLLDWALGSEEGHTFKKAELKTFLQFHREGEEPLRDDEITILNGVLSLNDRKASEIMTHIKDVLCLPSDHVLDHAALDHILLSGFSRIPVFEPGQKENFVGMLLVKRLISYNPEECKKVSEFPLLSLPEARPDINCFQALDYFQTGRAHLLLISEHPGTGKGALGIVSLEDLIEEIIGEEIVDETDTVTDNRSRRIAKRQGTAAVMRESWPFGLDHQFDTDIRPCPLMSGGIIERHRKQTIPSSRVDSPVPDLDGKLIQIEDTTYVINTAEPEDIDEAHNQSHNSSNKNVSDGSDKHGSNSSNGDAA
ncbi:hypothetical protein QFC21_003393 [Naganishia friedmannii]|uniref:Uncharacterized protein n=1 Tax=Naganishia friedmannii TaxID=89922 RepID=A0ACC2VQK6_9TREE|nr:hypothetical protein QFC21_003393 [Naganishia friedmannii]